MIFYVGGVPGVGKTAAVGHLTKRHQNVYEFKLVRAPVKELLCEYSGVASVEEYQTLPKAFRSSLHLRVSKRIYQLDNEDPKLIRIYDSHFCALDSHGKIEAIRQAHAGDKDQLLAVAILVAKPSFILRRRMSDETIRRDRFVGNCRFIRREQELEVKTASFQVKTLSIPFECFRNEESLDEIDQQLFFFLEKVVAERKVRCG